MEINRDNIKVLISAYKITDEVFQERGYAPGLVNLTGYLQTGDLRAFTNTNGARQTMENIDFNELTCDVKASLIEYTIGIIGTPEKAVDLNNHIEKLISSWVNGVQGNIEFDELYQRMLTDPRYSKQIYESLCIGQMKYNKAQINMQNGNIPPYLIGTINFLERVKEDIINQKKVQGTTK